MDVDAFGAANAGLALTAVGRVEPGTGVAARQGGREVPLPDAYDHFAGR
jgi:hypothetical protein